MEKVIHDAIESIAENALDTVQRTAEYYDISGVELAWLLIDTLSAMEQAEEQK